MRLLNRSVTISTFLLLLGLVLLGVPLAAVHAANVTLKHPASSSSFSSPARAQICGTWTTVASPNVGTHATTLSGMAAISANDVWSVGFYYPNNMSTRTVIEHWNGASWRIVPSPATGGSYSFLLSVTALSAQNVWAVGSYLPSITQTLIEHWNGARWSIVPSPNVPTAVVNDLSAITAISASDIWAVGHYENSSGVNQTLIEHWDGSSWSIVSSPNAGSGGNNLEAVTASSANNVWVVGGFHSTTTSTVFQTLVEHWNGSSWSIVSSPNVGSLGSSLQGVTAVSANNIWAVGSYTVAGSPSSYEQTLTERWNGSTWSVVSSPDVGSNWNILESVTNISSTNVWAVGYYLNSSSNGQTLTEHWNGKSWKVVSSSNVGIDNFLQAVTPIPGTSELWTVGSYHQTLHTVSQTLTEFYC